MDLEINISELRLIMSTIFDHLENEAGIKRIRLDQDDYWEVVDTERYDFTKSPEKFEHGQLSDDWQFLLPILKDKDQAVSFMLVHAAALLRRIGEQVGH